MAHQGNQGQGNPGQPGNTDREGNLGQSGSDIDNPTGTTGRQPGQGNENWQGDKNVNLQGGPAHRNDKEDEDEGGLGNRTTNQ